MNSSESIDPQPESLEVSEFAHLNGVLDQLVVACDQRADGRISVAEVQATLGERSFGPLLLVPGLIGLSPIGAIPGVPGIMAVIVFLISGQIVVGFKHFWLPAGIARRSMDANRLRRTIEAIRPYAHFVDRFLYARFTFLTRGPAAYLIAVMCLLVAAVTPVIELVPMAGIVPNAAIVAFALALTAQDGLWAAFAFLFTAGSIYLLAGLF